MENLYCNSNDLNYMPIETISNDGKLVQKFFVNCLWLAGAYLARQKFIW